MQHTGEPASNTHRFRTQDRSSRAVVARRALRWIAAVGLMVASFASGGASASAATPTCFGRNATIVSNASFVPGTPRADVIVAGAGKNSVVADSGADRVCTGGGDDFVRGDLGNDFINTGAGADVVSGGDLDRNNPSGNDTIFGGAGNDQLNGHDGNDVLHGDGGNDTLDGGPGADTIVGGPGNDTCIGGGGADTFQSCETIK